MIRTILLSLPLLLVSQSAWASDRNTTGSSAVALAGVVAPYSPTLAAPDKAAMASIFDGGNPDVPAGKKITVVAESIACFASHVAINEFHCNLAFGNATTKVTGRKANEIYAALMEAGVPPDAGAGTSYEALTELRCTIDPDVIKKQEGGGASCSFATSP
jgi:hypothetical protein